MQVKVPVLSEGGEVAEARIGSVKRVSDAMLMSFVGIEETIGVVDGGKCFEGDRDLIMGMLDLGTMEVPER